MVDMDALKTVMEDAGFPSTPFTPNYLAFYYHKMNGLAKKEIALYGLAYPEGIYPQELLDDIAAAAGEPPEITTASLPNGTVGTPYNQTLAATGDTPITWAIGEEGDPLPAGLSLNSSSGAITGTPSEDGAFEIDFVASNAAGSDTKTLTLTIQEA